MEEILQRLKKIEGKELKYKQLCEALNLQIKTSNSKIAQLNNLQMYCKLTELANPKRYLIEYVYDKELRALGLDNQKNKFQIMFEAALYQAFLENNGQPIYLSTMDAIKLFREVNDNFSYACNPANMQLMGEEYEYMPKVGKIIYQILRQWTLRRIDYMNERHTALKETGYRLYKSRIYEGKPYITFLNVPQDSNMARQCQAIYNKAIEEIMPEDWGEPKPSIPKSKDSEEKDKKYGKYWVPDYIWNKFEKRIEQLVKQEFNGEFDTLKPVIVLRPPTSKYIKEKLEKMCQKLQSLTHINEEACRKALTTAQLDYITNNQRKLFIEINMTPNPEFSFKKEIKKKLEGIL